MVTEAPISEAASGKVRTTARWRVELRSQDAVIGHWDRSRVDQVVTNLISNALQCGGASIEVTLAVIGAEARLAVRDDRPGISAADQSRIWNQFERAAPHNIAGMGLGLWIVRRMVAAHGGSVGLASELGRGTSFIVTLPLGESTRGASP
jgi:signal transduction histidine kinase